MKFYIIINNIIMMKSIKLNGDIKLPINSPNYNLDILIVQIKKIIII